MSEATFEQVSRMHQDVIRLSVRLETALLLLGQLAGVDVPALHPKEEKK